MNILLSLFVLLVSIKPEVGRLTIYQNGKAIGTEEFKITPKPGGYFVEGQTILTMPQKVALKSKMELNEALIPTSYEFESGGSSIKMKVESPVSELEYSVNGQKEGSDVRFPKDGAIIDSNFFHHYALLLYRISGVKGSTTLSAFVPQQLELGPITVKSLGDNTFEFDTGNVKVKARTDNEGRLIRLEVPDAKVVVER